MIIPKDRVFLLLGNPYSKLLYLKKKVQFDWKQYPCRVCVSICTTTTHFSSSSQMRLQLPSLCLVSSQVGQCRRSNLILRLQYFYRLLCLSSSLPVKLQMSWVDQRLPSLIMSQGRLLASQPYFQSLGLVTYSIYKSVFHNLIQHDYSLLYDLKTWTVLQII